MKRSRIHRGAVACIATAEAGTPAMDVCRNAYVCSRNWDKRLIRRSYVIL